MIELILILLLFIELITFIVYEINFMIQISKRKKNTISIDQKMLTVGRIFTWGPVIGISFITRGIHLDTNYYLFFATLLLMIYIGGSRLYFQSFKVEDENKNDFFCPLDQWLEKMYKKHLEPLWKDKEDKS